MSCHQVIQLLPSNLSELEETKEAWTIQVRVLQPANSESCAADWRELYIKSKINIITCAFLKVKYHF